METCKNKIDMDWQIRRIPKETFLFAMYRV